MKIAALVIRSLLGLVFVVFGLNIFLHFIPIPPKPEGPARDFMTALTVSHYIYVVGALEFVGGVFLLVGRLVPLGQTLLGPVIVNILCVHVFLDRSGVPSRQATGGKRRVDDSSFNQRQALGELFPNRSYRSDLLNSAFLQMTGRNFNIAGIKAA